jgi:undecaprenyl-diphosphatase
MSTFQAIVYGIIHGFTEFVPVSSNAHDLLVPYLFNWPGPSGALSGALSLGALLALLVYFRHDWASIFSCFLQVIIFRKKPMTLDERLPLFLLITSLPSGLIWYYFHEQLLNAEWSPWVVAALLGAFAIPLVTSENFSRKNKGMFDWTWLDALILGVAQMASFVPGCGRMTALLPAALLRNFNREAAAKYAMFASMPYLAGSSLYWLRGVSLHAPRPMADVSWLSFGMALIVSLFAALLSIGGFMKHIQTRGFGTYAAYRIVIAAIVAGAFWFRR